MAYFDTIAALSTPFGKGGIAVIRISGSEALAVADRAFFPKNRKKLSEIGHGLMVYGEIRHDGETVDDGMAVTFRAPRSFTGEDTVEISCHGGILITQKVLSAVLSCGARSAEAGEFTRRAFVNGKMGLTEAEALGSLLEAGNDEQLRISRGAMSGRLGERCGEIYSSLRSVLAQVYANVDYPEEDLADMSADEMKNALSGVLEGINSLKDTYKTGHAVMEGVKTVICGKTNVGKSSLYNALVGRDAAIVTNIEGTTRDVLCETVSLGRVTLRLFDTAGIRKTEDAVERIGVERTLDSITEAELIFAVLDNSRPLDNEDIQILDNIKQLKCAKIAIINKNDENSMISDDDIPEFFDAIVRTSAKSGGVGGAVNGIDDLKRAVEQLYINERIDTSADAVVMNARQNASLELAAKHTALAISALDMGLSADLAGVDVELAMSALSELEGREVGEDVVSEIFSHFCVGK